MTRVRKMEVRDIEAILAIQLASPEIAQWSAISYQGVSGGEMAGWVSEDDRGVAGFLAARELVGETEILNLAVREDVRRRGIGAKLIEAVIAWSRELGAERLMLEVRVSNENAIRFYERHGFVAAGGRTKYYAEPVEDALLLSLALGNE